MDVFVSENDGLSWIQTYSFNHQVIGSILVSGTTIFISDGTNGLYRSDDWGNSFIEKNSEINESYAGSHSVVSFTENSNGVLYRLSQQEIYSSANKGESWSKITYNLTYPFYGLIGTNQNGEVLFFNTLTSETYLLNQSTNKWNLMSSSFPFKNEVPNGIVSTANGLFYFTSTRGIYKGSQNGQSWFDSNKNIPIHFFIGLGITKDSVLMTSTEIGVSKFLSNNWSTIPATSTGNLLYPGRLFTFRNGYSLLASGYLSTNDVVWNHLNHYFSQIVKGENGILYAYSNDFINSVQTPELYKSIDQGQSWTEVDVDALPLLNLQWNGIAADSSDVYLLGRNELTSKYELYKVNLTAASAILIYSSSEPLSHLGIKDGSIYLNSMSGLNRSDDYGTSWKMIFTVVDPTGEIGNIAPNFDLVGRTIWVGGLFGEIKYSADKGDTWIDKSFYLNDKNARASNFIADRKGQMYITMDKFGVIKSIAPILESDLLDPLEDEIPGGDEVPEEIITSIEGDLHRKPIIYPNPTESKLFISFPDNFTGSYHITLYNLNGQKILTAFSPLREFSVDLNSTPSGMYILKVDDGHQTFISKVLKNN